MTNAICFISAFLSFYSIFLTIFFIRCIKYFIKEKYYYTFYEYCIWDKDNLPMPNVNTMFFLILSSIGLILLLSSLFKYLLT
jgi:hypothetical protein